MREVDGEILISLPDTHGEKPRQYHPMSAIFIFRQNKFPQVASKPLFHEWNTLKTLEYHV